MTLAAAAAGGRERTEGLHWWVPEKTIEISPVPASDR